MKLLLMDLDATLIDLTEFKSFLFTQLEERYSIPKEGSISRYNSVKLKDKWPELLLNLIHKEFSAPLDELKELFEECFSKIVLNENVVSYLKTFQGRKIIFSFGTYDFQMQKINQFGLEKVVDGIIITLERKFDYLSKIIHNDTVELKDEVYTEVTLVDNDLDLLAEVGHVYPWIQTISVHDMI